MPRNPALALAEKRLLIPAANDEQIRVGWHASLPLRTFECPPVRRAGLQIGLCREGERRSALSYVEDAGTLTGRVCKDARTGPRALLTQARSVTLALVDGGWKA